MVLDASKVSIGYTSSEPLNYVTNTSFHRLVNVMYIYVDEPFSWMTFLCRVKAIVRY